MAFVVSEKCTGDFLPEPDLRPVVVMPLIEISKHKVRMGTAEEALQAFSYLVGKISSSA